MGFLRKLSGPFRVLPDFLIIGAPKCGTTSMYLYLLRHPSMRPAYRKETHFFSDDRYYSNGSFGYRKMFATYFFKIYFEKIKKLKFLTGEASPGYLRDKKTPERVFKVLPKIKLIVLLRNPVNRSFARYQQQIRRKNEVVQEKSVNNNRKFIPISEEKFFNSKFLTEKKCVSFR